MKFSWIDGLIDGEDIKQIEENIENEIAHLQSVNSRQVADLTVTLSHDLASHMLHGFAYSPEGAVSVSFSYSLRDGHLAKYDSHPSA